MPTTTLPIRDWGRTVYPTATARQQTQVQARIDGRIGDELIFTEHEPVYTVGLRAGAAAHLLWDPVELRAQGISVAETNRGGDITYHGPGQIVGYPIVDLSPVKDLHAYLRFLEEVMIQTVGGFGLVASRRDGLTGIWVETRKIAAIGVAVRRWVAYHGFALNVDPNLDHFAGIVPCGIASADGSVTSLARELASPPSVDEVKVALAREFQAWWPSFLTPA